MKTGLLTIVAVAIGLAAGFGVAVAIHPEPWTEEKHEVLAVQGEIAAGQVLEARDFEIRSIPMRYIPPNSIDAANIWLVEGLQTKTRIVKGDIVRYSDIDLEPTGNGNAMEGKGL